MVTKLNPIRSENLVNCSSTSFLIIEETLIISTTIGTLLEYSLPTSSLTSTYQSSMNVIECLEHLREDMFLIGGQRVELWKLPLHQLSTIDLFTNTAFNSIEDSVKAISVCPFSIMIAAEEQGVFRFDLNLENPQFLYKHTNPILAFDHFKRTEDPSKVLPDNDLISSACTNNELVIYKDHYKKIIKLKDTVFCLKFDISGNHVICGEKEGNIFVFSILASEIVRNVNIHESRIKCLAISNFDSIIVTGSFDMNGKVLSINEQEVIFTLEGHFDWISTIAVHEKLKLIVTGSDDRTIKFWDYSDLKVKRKSYVCGNAWDYMCSMLSILTKNKS